jgi:hypothetical protein
MALLLSAGLLAATTIAIWHSTRSSRLYWKVSARICAVVLAIVSVLTLLLFLFRGAMCGRYDFPPVSSADGHLMAAVNEEDCGAVDSFHSSVEVWQERQGIVAHLLGKREHSMTVFAVGHDPRLIELEWRDAKTLLIHYPNDFRNAREFRCKSKWGGGVQIECIPFTPNYSKPVAKMPPVKRWFW